MQVNIGEQNGVKICHIAGDIDINTSPQVKKALDVLTKEKAPKVLINLKDVPYVDSSGLATLVEILKNFRSHGGKLKLCNLSDKVQSLFEITKLEKLFDVAADEHNALEAFQ